MKTTYCNFCNSELEPGREFIYQMESLNFLNDERLLEAIHNMPEYVGEPLRICKLCHASFEQNRRELEEEQETHQREQRISLLVIGVAIALTAAMVLGSCIISAVRDY